MKRLYQLSIGLLIGILYVTSAQAWSLSGGVTCASGLPFSGVTINVTGTNCDGPYAASTQTDADGNYLFDFPCPGAYTASIDMHTLPADATAVTFSQSSFVVDDNFPNNGIYWQVTSAACQVPQSTCRLAGLAAKTEFRSGRLVVSGFGGLVRPSCQGSNCWDHVDGGKKLNFHSTAIQITNCGDGGTTAQPFHFIEFSGTGTLKGIDGNRANYGTVYFVARAEDRRQFGKTLSPPDRYFIRIYSNAADPVGSTLVLLGGNTSDPAANTVPITLGELQVRKTTCN